MLTVFPLTTASDRRWWSHCRSLGSPEMSTSFFSRQLKKGAVDLKKSKEKKTKVGKVRVEPKTIDIAVVTRNHYTTSRMTFS